MNLPSFPPVGGPAGAAFNMIAAAFRRAVAQDEAVSFVSLLSPSGKVYRVSISDTGQIVVTASAKSDPPAAV